MPLDLLFGTGKFRGIDNVTDPISLNPDGRSTWMTVANNLDLNDENKLSRRGGYDPKISGSFHSLWSKNGDCYAVKDGALVRISEDYIPTTIIPSVDWAGRFSYWDRSGRVYLTNGSIIGYIKDDVFTTFVRTDQNYKVVMPPGHLICFHNSRMMVARDRLLFISDATSPHHYDNRTGWRQRATRITMMLPVVDGVYFSDQGRVYFASGADFLEATLLPKTDCPAIEGTGILVDGEDLFGEDIGTVALWASKEGIFLGAPGGKVKNLTWDHYVMDDAVIGTAIYREDLPFGQYLVSYEIPPEQGDGDVSVVIPAWRAEAIGTIT